MSLQYDREEAAIESAYERGEITHKEMCDEIKELNRSFSQHARECAQEAYDRELERHW